MLVGFCLFCVFFVAKISLKKIWNCLESVLIASFTILLMCILLYYYTTILSSTHLWRIIFYQLNTIFLLYALILIGENLFLFMIICENLLLTIIICENLFLFVKIYFYLCALIFICENLFFSFYLWSSSKIFSYLWSICENLFS